MIVRDKPVATGQVTINATPTAVYGLISDPTVMVTFAEEAYGARWLAGANTAAVGARFKGLNRNGWRRWVTTCEITELEPELRFTYEVNTPFNVPISRWQYDIEPVEQGCVVTESNWLRVPLWFIPLAIMITGVPNRIGANNANIATTLDRLKEHVEAGRT